MVTEVTGSLAQRWRSAHTEKSRLMGLESRYHDVIDTGRRTIPSATSTFYVRSCQLTSPLKVANTSGSEVVWCV